MKFSLLGIFCLVNLINAFKNTGMMYVSSPLLIQGPDQKKQHYMKSNELKELLSPYMEELPTVVFQLSKDLNNKVDKKFFDEYIGNEKTLFTPEHDYSSFEAVSLSKFNENNYDSMGKNIVVENVLNDEASVKEFSKAVNRLTQEKKYNVIIEFLPSHLMKKSLSDRSFSIEEMQADTDILMEDLDEVFNKYVEEAAKEGSMATIYNNDNEKFTAIPVEGKSLFETYQFFSNGVLLAIFVCFFLVYVTLQGLAELSQPIFDKYSIFGSIPASIIRDPFYDSLIAVCYSISIITVLSWSLMLLMILSTTKFKKILIFLTLLYAIDISIILTKTTVLLNEQFALNYQDSFYLVKTIIYDNLVFALNLIVRILVIVNWYLFLSEILIFNKNDKDTGNNNNSNYIHQYITEEGSQEEDNSFQENEIENKNHFKKKYKAKWYTYFLKYEVFLGLIIWYFIIHLLEYLRIQGKFDAGNQPLNSKLIYIFGIINNLIIFISFLIFVNYYYYFKIIRKRKYLFPSNKKKIKRSKSKKREDNFRFLNNSDNESSVEDSHSGNNNTSMAFRNYHLKYNIYNLLTLLSVLNFSPLIFYVLSLSVFQNWSIFFIDFLSIFVTILNWELYQRISELKFFLELKNSIGRKIKNDNDLAVVVNYKFKNNSNIDDPKHLTLRLKKHLTRKRRGGGRAATETTITENEGAELNEASNIVTVTTADDNLNSKITTRRRHRRFRKARKRAKKGEENDETNSSYHHNDGSVPENVESSSSPENAGPANLGKFIRTIFSPISDNIQLHKITEIRLNTPVNNKASIANQTTSITQMGDADEDDEC